MAKYDSDEIREILKRINIQAEGSNSKQGTFVGGRASYTQPIDDTSEVEVGASGHYAKGRGYKDAGVDRADINYRKRFKNESELRARLGANLNKEAGRRGVDEIGVVYEIPFKKGGRVKTKKTASTRGDGCAKRGKTRGKYK